METVLLGPLDNVAEADDQHIVYSNDVVKLYALTIVFRDPFYIVSRNRSEGNGWPGWADRFVY